MATAASTAAAIAAEAAVAAADAEARLAATIAATIETDPGLAEAVAAAAGHPLRQSTGRAAKKAAMVAKIAERKRRPGSEQPVVVPFLLPGCFYPTGTPLSVAPPRDKVLVGTYRPTAAGGMPKAEAPAAPTPFARRNGDADEREAGDEGAGAAGTGGGSGTGSRRPHRQLPRLFRRDSVAIGLGFFFGRLLFKAVDVVFYACEGERD